MRLGIAMALALLPVPSAAQDLPSPGDLTSASGIASAARNLAGEAEDRLLVRDLLGKELKGADGNTLGTVEDLAVIPGGRVVAAIVSTGNGKRIAVPFAAVKLAGTGSSLEVPVAASDLAGRAELRSLAESLSD